MWQHLPKELTKLVLDKYLQGCNKQKSIRNLVNNVFDTIKAKHSLDNDVRVDFSILVKRGEHVYKRVECLLLYNCLFITHVFQQPSRVSLFECNTTQYMFGTYNDTSAQSASSSLYDMIVALYDTITIERYEKPKCLMYITRTNTTEYLSLPPCPDVYIDRINELVIV
jgi:hypothetical protein